MDDTGFLASISLITSLIFQLGPSPRSPASALLPYFPPAHINLALSTIKLLNAIARHNLPFLQFQLSSLAHSTQIFHISTFFIRYCAQHIENSIDFKSGGPDAHPNAETLNGPTFELFQELVLLLGYNCYQNSAGQSLMHQGPFTPPIVQRLAALPFRFFLDPELKTILFPTLILACYNHPVNTNFLIHELNPKVLVNYLLECSESPKAVLPAAVDAKFALSHRFGHAKWDSAVKFLQHYLPEDKKVKFDDALEEGE
jgi:hypothetical protein